MYSLAAVGAKYFKDLLYLQLIYAKLNINVKWLRDMNTTEYHKDLMYKNAHDLHIKIT